MIEKKKKVNKNKKIEKEAVVDVIKFEDLEGKFLVVKVGSDELPANSDQIKDVCDSLTILFEKNNINCATFVTHHCVEICILEKQRD